MPLPLPAIRRLFVRFAAAAKSPQCCQQRCHNTASTTPTTATTDPNAGQKLTDRQRKLMARSLPKRAPLVGVQHIVVVASGKGGVGKSTTACNLAITLAQRGHRVGLLDADIFGPSVPLMMNAHETPLVNDANQMIPPVNFNVKCLSMGQLVDAAKPVVWRGPLVMSALQRLLRGAVWAPLDVLVVDTPPGTGDVHLSLVQHVPVAGVLLVSTPQRAALEVTRRGAQMYARSMGVPLVGLVENMTAVPCGKCGESVELFDASGVSAFCDELGVRVLGRMPMERAIGEGGDRGRPMVVAQPESVYAREMGRVAAGVVEFLKL